MSYDRLHVSGEKMNQRNRQLEGYRHSFRRHGAVSQRFPIDILIRETLFIRRESLLI